MASRPMYSAIGGGIASPHRAESYCGQCPFSAMPPTYSHVTVSRSFDGIHAIHVYSLNLW